MVRLCVVSNCTNKMTSWAKVTFHRLPFHNLDLLKLWLVVLNLDPNSTVEALRRADHRVCSVHFAAEDFFPQKPTTGKEEQKTQRMRLLKNAIPRVEVGTADTKNTLRLADLRVCSAHFSKEDYCQPKRRRNPIPKHLFLKKTAYPRVDRASDPVEPKDDVDGPGRISSTGTQVPETCTEAIKKLSLHHIVEEDAILQLMRNCPMCNRMCRCSKRSNGAYLIIYQNCYFCQFSRKWANQPGAADINIQKAKKQVKKKRQPKPKKKEPEKAEAEPVKQEEEEFAVTELLVPV